MSCSVDCEGPGLQKAHKKHINTGNHCHAFSSPHVPSLRMHLNTHRHWTRMEFVIELHIFSKLCRFDQFPAKETPTRRKRSCFFLNKQSEHFIVIFFSPLHAASPHMVASSPSSSACPLPLPTSCPPDPTYRHPSLTPATSLRSQVSRSSLALVGEEASSLSAGPGHTRRHGF